MLEKLQAEELVKGISYLASVAKRMSMIHYDMVRNGLQFTQLDLEEDIGRAFLCVTVFERVAQQLGMAGVLVGIGHTKQLLNVLAPMVNNVPQLRVNEYHQQLNLLISHFGNEMEGRTLFVMRPKFAGYYDPASPLFGEPVDAAFPSSAPEIAEAGKCLAVGRWTAAVVHLMRALEPALKALQDAVQVDIPKEQWDQIINQIEAKIKTIRKRTHGKSDEQWFSEAAAQFRFLKDAWRNYANHLHERYDEERAEEIFNSVKAFMKHLATRLSEPDPITTMIG
jgi:hypothetical protein